MTKWIALALIVGGIALASRFVGLDSLPVAALGYALAALGVLAFVVLGFMAI